MRRNLLMISPTISGISENTLEIEDNSNLLENTLVIKDNIWTLRENTLEIKQYLDLREDALVTEKSGIRTRIPWRLSYLDRRENTGDR